MLGRRPPESHLSRRRCAALSVPVLVEPAPASLHIGGHGHHADRAVGFEDGEFDLVDVADLAVLAHGGADFVLGDSFAVEVGGDELAVMHKHDRDPFDELADPDAPKSEPGNDGVGCQQGGGRDEASLQCGVGADHGVLHSVGDEKVHDEIKRGQLAELAAPAEPEPDENGRVDDEGSADDLDQVHELGASGEQIFWWSSVAIVCIALTISSASTLVL